MSAKAKRALQQLKETVKRFTAWSFSRWQDYEQCPAKAKYKHIDKRREPDNPAMEKGTIVHKLAEQFTSGQLVKFPSAELGKLKPFFVDLKKAKAMAEQEWAFDQQWNQVGWFAPTAFVRIKVDAHYLEQKKVGRKMETTVVVVDHKTGREHAEHAQQRSLYALGAFHMYPDATRVVAWHWYIDSGQRTKSEYKASDLPTLLGQWEQRTRAMLNDTRFAPRPGGYCRWCHFRKANGGPCEF